MKQQFLVRQIAQCDELRQMFALRYRVFRESDEARGFAPENTHAMTIDAYDQRSLHFGLYRQEDRQQQLIGAMRICFADGHVHNSYVNPLCTGCTALEKAVTKQTSELPFLGYSQLSPGVQEWFDNIEKGSLVEPGRFFVDQASRHSGLGLFMLRSMTAIAHYHFGVETAIVAGSRIMAPMYLKFGFERIRGMGSVHTNGVEYILFGLRPGELPQAQRMSLMEKAEAYGRTGQIIHEADAIRLAPRRLMKTA